MDSHTTKLGYCILSYSLNETVLPISLFVERERERVREREREQFMTSYLVFPYDIDSVPRRVRERIRGIKIECDGAITKVEQQRRTTLEENEGECVAEGNRRRHPVRDRSGIQNGGVLAGGEEIQTYVNF